MDITGQTDVTVKAATGAVALQSTGLDGEVAITGLAGVNVNSASTIGMVTTGRVHGHQRRPRALRRPGDVHQRRAQLDAGHRRVPQRPRRHCGR